VNDQLEVTTDANVIADTKTDVPPNGKDEVLSFYNTVFKPLHAGSSV